MLLCYHGLLQGNMARLHMTQMRVMARGTLTHENTIIEGREARYWCQACSNG